MRCSSGRLSIKSVASAIPLLQCISPLPFSRMLFSVLPVFLAISSAWAQSSAVDAYLALESSVAKAGLLANIGPSGSKSSGAKSGIVIASPSHSNPDYLFTWTRDSSLVFQTIINQQVSSSSRSLLVVDTRTRPGSRWDTTIV